MQVNSEPSPRKDAMQDASNRRKVENWQHLSRGIKVRRGVASEGKDQGEPSCGTGKGAVFSGASHTAW